MSEHGSNTPAMDSRLPSCSLVSVIIPVRNRPELVCQAIESVRRQTYGHWEAVVVDDGSTDDTAERIARLGALDQRVRLLRRQGDKGGAPVCRNLGFRASRGQYVIFLDSDDLLAPTCLEHRLAVMEERRDVDFSVFSTQLFKIVPGDVRVLFCKDTGEDDLERFLRWDIPWQTTGPIWRRSALEKLGPAPWDEELHTGQDVDLSVRAIIHQLRYMHAGHSDYYHRVFYTAEQETVGDNSWSEGKLPSHMRRIRKVSRLLSESRLLRGKLRPLIAGNYFWISAKWAGHGEIRQALRFWRDCRAKKLISCRDYQLGCLFFLCRRFWMRSIVFHYIYRWWSEDMFICRYSFGSDPDADNPVPRHISSPRHPYHQYTEVATDGIVRYIGRRLAPRRFACLAKQRLCSSVRGGNDRAGCTDQ